jgi:6-pyruvoyl-tetrahydropterin synthase
MQLFVEHLTTIDSAYLHPDHGLVGESWIVDVALGGVLDDASMVMDFAHVKKRLKAAIDASLDHVLIAPQRARNLSISYSPPEGGSKRADGLRIEWQFGNGEKLSHFSPEAAVALLDSDCVTDVAMIAYLEHILAPVLPSTVRKLSLTLRHEDPAACSYYHYVHGLKTHDGHCQRIAHGHRSRIMIWKNGARAPALEAAWAAEWKTAYLATRADILAEKNGMLEMGYEAGEGRFALSYPSHRCHILETDSTVEQIATHIATTLKAHDPAASFRVRAYEGVHKGAVAEA